MLYFWVQSANFVFESFRFLVNDKRCCWCHTGWPLQCMACTVSIDSSWVYLLLFKDNTKRAGVWKWSWPSFKGRLHWWLIVLLFLHLLRFLFVTPLETNVARHLAVSVSCTIQRDFGGFRQGWWILLVFLFRFEYLLIIVILILFENVPFASNWRELGVKSSPRFNFTWGELRGRFPKLLQIFKAHCV